MAAPTSANGSIQQACPVAVQLSDGSWALQSGGVYAVPVLISSGQSLSAAIDLGLNSLSGLQFPAAWTAAVLTFQVSADGVTFGNFYKSDGVTEYSIPVTASICQPPPSLPDFAAWRYIKFRSGTSASPVAQAADRTIMITTRPV